MPVSKKRARHKPPQKRRDRSRDMHILQTQAAQEKAASVKKLTPAAYTRRRIIGWSLVGLAVGVFLQHLIGHLGFFHFASPGVEDLVAGYPLAGLLGVVGAIVLSK